MTKRTYSKTKTYIPYAEAAEKVREAGIKSSAEYSMLYKKCGGLPSNPHVVYAANWINWSVFLTGRDTITKCSYLRASEIARENKVRTWNEYTKLTFQYPELPRYPDEYYGDEWVDFKTFLLPPGVKVFDYETACAEIKKLGVKSEVHYKSIAADDLRFPWNPSCEYKDVWQGWHVFFGRPKPVKKYTFKEAQVASQKLGIKSFNEYVKEKGYQRDPALPSTPTTFYKEDWEGWDHFLGVTP